MKQLKIKVSASFIIAIIVFSSVSSILITILTDDDSDIKINFDVLPKKETIINIELSKTDAFNKGQNYDEQGFDVSNNREETYFYDNTKSKSDTSSLGSDSVNRLFQAHSLIQLMVEQKGILHSDVFNSIDSDSINATYSDNINFNSEIKNIKKESLSDINVTFYIFRYSDTYPDFIANNTALSCIYDEIWFYLYYYNYIDILDDLNNDKLGQWLLSLYDFILDSFTIQNVGKSTTDENGIIKINNLDY